MTLGTETEMPEFKKSTGELKEAVISIVAILNKHQKGELYFGVLNDGTPKGQTVSDKTLRDISRQAVNSRVEPKMFPLEDYPLEDYIEREERPALEVPNNCPKNVYRDSTESSGDN